MQAMLRFAVPADTRNQVTLRLAQHSCIPRRKAQHAAEGEAEDSFAHGGHKRPRVLYVLGLLGGAP